MELLAVVAIIGVLVGLLLPAVQVARESARRSTCGNNIKQVVLAAHNFESAKGYFPPSGRGYGICNSGATGSDPATTILNASGMLYLLPYLEQGAVFDQFKIDQTIARTTPASVFASQTTFGSTNADPSTNGNAALCGTILPDLLCPTDYSADARGRLPGGSSDQLSGNYGPDATRSGAATNYDFTVNSRSNTVCRAWKQHTVGTRFMSGEDTMTRTKDVIDGLSKTFMFGETTRASSRSGDRPLAWAYRHSTGIGVCSPNPYATTNLNTWVSASNPVGIFGRVDSWVANAASMHPGGVHFAMGDAAVRFIPETTTFTILWQLGCMADGNSVTVP